MKKIRYLDSFHCTKKWSFLSRVSSVNVQIWSHLLKKSLIENFIFRVVFECTFDVRYVKYTDQRKSHKIFPFLMAMIKCSSIPFLSRKKADKKKKKIASPHHCFICFKNNMIKFGENLNQENYTPQWKADFKWKDGIKRE